MTLSEQKIREILKKSFNQKGNFMIFLDDKPEIDIIQSFDEKADIYSTITSQNKGTFTKIDDYFKEEIEKHMGTLNEENPNLLDIGTGDGSRIKGYKDLGLQIEAYDLSSKMVEKANEKLSNVYIGGYSDIKSNSYNVITSLHSVINIGTEQEIIERLKQVYNGLKENGLFCFDVIHADSDKRFIVYYNLDNNGQPYKKNGREIVSWSRLLSEDEIKEYSKQANFKVVDIESIEIYKEICGYNHAYNLAVLKK